MDHTIAAGTLSGDVLTWLMAIFSVPIATLLTGWLYRLFQMAGIQMTDALRARLQTIVVNGLNAFAQRAADSLRNRSPAEIRNAAINSAVDYVTRQGGDTIRALGIDPHSTAALEAIRAHIETAITDPATPTNPILAVQPPVNPPPAGWTGTGPGRAAAPPTQGGAT